MVSDTEKLRNAHHTFPFSRQALENYSLTPEFDYLDINNARLLNYRLVPSFPALTAGQIAAVGLIGKIFLHLIDLYCRSSQPHLFPDLDTYLAHNQDIDHTNESLSLALEHYPTTPTFYTPTALSRYLLLPESDPHSRHGFYHSVLLVVLVESNPALHRLDGVFADTSLYSTGSYQTLIKALKRFFLNQPQFSPAGLSLLDLLQQPARSSPDSIEGQLSFILQNWAAWLDESILNQLLKMLGTLREETKPAFGGLGPPQDPLGFAWASYLSDSDLVRFSADLDWMPNLVLIAKNVFVWLDQLSKKYRRSIYRLDHIPDDELKQLSEWGFTGLWLIGLWQRSPASQKIKQICGNVDAVPSAYSLYDYVIADALGGDSAYRDLASRASLFRIRLAADMVPNHMGVYSKWVIEHPDWFLSLPGSPYPVYTFQGPDLSEDSRVGIFIEDHYYSQSDAAVVFKRVDKTTGSSRFIYHGNDGTSMPWNDTAQLDFLNPQVREAVIQTILHVARKFPVIRFDAAMTLAKKHFQRLWFPEPGSGGAIPTRSEHGLTRKDFEQAMPQEFWREVVDRVAAEAPDTLLLAEAFWMMEGYFVRTLGMHRVYNSAFMHMLRDEHNQKFRELIINTLEFDPQILKRYVNFMNNPDEETAIAQFGSDGKYFGVCTLMATLPGLPMFGHGQIEGYAEKYGMEYQRAYYDETPNFGLIDRHRREIFPLLHKRHLFSEVDHFYLYDPIDHSGSLVHDVIAFSNFRGEEKALVLYNNKWGTFSGKIHYSTPIKGRSVTFLDALGLVDLPTDYILFQDHVTGLEYIRPYQELQSSGLGVDLGAYHYQVLVNFKGVSEDPFGTFAQLNSSLSGKGITHLQEEFDRIKFSPLTSVIFRIISYFHDQSSEITDPAFFAALEDNIIGLLQSLKRFFPDQGEQISNADPDDIAKGLLFQARPDFPSYLKGHLACISSWLLLRNILSLSETMNLVQFTYHTVQASITDTSSSYVANCRTLFELDQITGLIDHSPLDIARSWFSNSYLKENLSVNEYQGITWYNEESFRDLVDLTLASIYFDQLQKPKQSKRTISAMRTKLKGLRKTFLSAMVDSEFHVDLLLSSLKDDAGG